LSVPQLGMRQLRQRRDSERPDASLVHVTGTVLTLTDFLVLAEGLGVTKDFCLKYVEVICYHEFVPHSK
jgi:hypothetical protein